ncbi:MAG TPA: ActS/PrrB/RegB family redox-sensitive histidine kinase [Amaricoccus sp.]|nr:ActS/PrrB/RegB family redox-sensitive histidine kinase [Amaricoccus sp.]
MTESLSFPVPDARSEWLRLRTLILLRWLAVAGQTAAVLAATFALGFELPHLPVALVIGASVLFNVVAMAVAPRNRRLSQREAALSLLFDLCQLGTLLYLTGGLGNPFALLIMAPVTISAAALTRRATVQLAVAATLIITLLAGTSVPLHLATGEPLLVPRVLAAGTWTALVIGTAFLAIYARRVAHETFAMSQALAATQMALAREQQLSALGGVVAAAAHELGTPLATIKVAATELVEELAGQPALQEDAELVRAQADRCTEILRAMGPQGKQDALVRFAPFSSVVEEAAAPHADRGIEVITSVAGQPRSQPAMARSPEIVQGLRNLVQNAVDFAESTVWIDLDWDAGELRLRIGDDGPGYPPELLGRIGDPFVRKRPPPPAERPGYAGMGLGLFIAKTLLERSGGRVRFGNASDGGPPGPVRARMTGAIVLVAWPRDLVAREPDPSQGARGARVPGQG